MTEEEIAAEIARLQVAATAAGNLRIEAKRSIGRKAALLAATIAQVHEEELAKRQPRIAFLERKLARIKARAKQ